MSIPIELPPLAAIDSLLCVHVECAECDLHGWRLPRVGVPARAVLLVVASCGRRSVRVTCPLWTGWASSTKPSVLHEALSHSSPHGHYDPRPALTAILLRKSALKNMSGGASGSSPLRAGSTLGALFYLALCACFLALLSCVQASAETTDGRLVLQHRLSPSTSATSPTWSTRGFITLQNGTFGTFEQVQRASDLLTDDPAKEGGKKADLDGSYLLRLVRQGDEDAASQTQFVRTKQCLLEALVPGSFSSDALSLILDPSASTSLESLPVPLFSYSVVGLPPLDPATECPRSPIPRRGGSGAIRDTQLKLFVDVRQQAVGAGLRAAPRPRADGAAGAEVPPPEKSFLQKYWFYILPIMVLLALPSDAPAPSQEVPANAGARQIS
ncbi:unnamed protein product [Parajaminaea phylloscopi]